ncbi:HPP family protein [Cohnella sp. WQ 127256]|uniref:HPP family protein n=1 Tax=Cohnella sp. WQ 127256 TaxID=2938790 RepID=UPI0021188623|nr:HPP family protein [Cohnella sp. WQ 127256]
MKRQFVHFLTKMRGQGVSPLKVSKKGAFLGFIGGFIVIGILALFTSISSVVWVMAPFGASCVLAFVVWDAPLSQPRNIIGGHVVSTAVGLVISHLMGDSILSLALGVGLAISLMHLTRTTHPPAGADPIVVIMAGSSWSFLFSPVLIGAVVVVAIALIINNLDRERIYPKFWY